jgi:carboxymethylenebutenolidase
MVETIMAYTLDKFCAESRAILKAEKLPSALPQMAERLGRDTRRVMSCATALIAAAVLVVPSGRLAAQPAPQSAVAERVEFLSADGKSTLVGYLFKPTARSSSRTPAVVMMHGRAGAYSTLAHGVYDASTLSQRHQFWGRWWAEQSYLAILVDGFGPRGYGQGFPRGSYGSRPKELDEVTVRALDAYGALAYLRSRPDVLSDRIGLQGWSNGGSATLATVATNAPGIDEHTPAAGFRAALAFYPACGLKKHFATTGYRAYAPLRVFMGTADEEVSPRVCRVLLDHASGDIQTSFYEGATHDFDDPGRRRQSVGANAAARKDVLERATVFFAEQLAGVR